MGVLWVYCAFDTVYEYFIVNGTAQVYHGLIRPHVA